MLKSAANSAASTTTTTTATSRVSWRVLCCVVLEANRTAEAWRYSLTAEREKGYGLMNKTSFEFYKTSTQTLTDYLMFASCPLTLDVHLLVVGGWPKRGKRKKPMMAE